MKQHEGRVERELNDLRQQLRRYQVYLGIALAVIGLGTISSIGLLAFYGLRVAAELARTEERVSRLGDDTADTAEALSQALSRQQQEITAIRKAANEDLQAIQEANRKLAAIRDPGRELSALREANEALWSELATQRVELLEALHDKAPPIVVPGRSRFQLGQTIYTPTPDESGELRGFVGGGEDVHRATEASQPAHLVLEMEPRTLRLGDPYRLVVQLVNRSNQTLAPVELRLDWTFGTKNTGGPVPLKVRRVEPRQSTLVYELRGDWTPAHADGAVTITATLALADGATFRNTLRW